MIWTHDRGAGGYGGNGGYGHDGGGGDDGYGIGYGYGAPTLVEVVHDPGE